MQNTLFPPTPIHWHALPPKISASTLMNTRLFVIRKANFHHRFISQYDTPYRFNKLDLMAIPSASLCTTLITKYSVFVGSETHFKVVVISDTFEGMPLIKVMNILLFFGQFFSLIDQLMTLP